MFNKLYWLLMLYLFLTKTAFFNGLSENEIKTILNCFGAYQKSFKKSLYSIGLKRYNTGDIKREKKGERRRWLIYSMTSWQASGFLLLVLIHVGENNQIIKTRELRKN